MSGTGQAEQPQDEGDQPGQNDGETDLAELYQLAIVSFERRAYGHSLRLLSQISKLNPSYDDRENLRARVATALDQQQRELVFRAAKTEAERALQQKHGDDIPNIIAAMNARLAAENLALNDTQRREVNQWRLQTRPSSKPRRPRPRRKRLFKPTASLQPPASGGVGSRVTAKPTVGERIGALPQYLLNVCRDFIRNQAWISIAVIVVFMACVLLIRSRLLG